MPFLFPPKGSSFLKSAQVGFNEHGTCWGLTIGAWTRESKDLELGIMYCGIIDDVSLEKSDAFYVYRNM